MSDTGLTRHSLIYIGAAAVNAGVPFLVLPLLARWLAPAGFGTVATFMAMVNVAAVLVGLSVHGQISVVFFKEGPHHLPAQVGACLGVLGITATPLLVCLWVAAPLISAATGVEEPWLWAVWLAACGQFVVMVSLAVWQVQRDPIRYAATQIGFTVSWAVLSLAFIGIARMGWSGRALGQAVAAGGMSVFCLVLLTRFNLIDWNPRRWPMKSALQFGIPLLPHSLAAVTMASIDRFALSGTVGVDAAGQYFVAFQIAAVLPVTAAAINQAWIPWMYRRLADPGPSALNELVRATHVLYAVLLAGAVLIATFRDELVLLIAGPAFAPAAPLLTFLAPAAALSGMYYFVTGYLFYAGRTGVLSTITVSCAIFQVGLTLFLVQHDGARGVAFAAAASSFLFWAATSWVANRIRPMPWFSILARKPG